MYCHYVYHRFRSSKGRVIRFFTHPLKISMFALRQKVLKASLQGKLNSDCYFIGLTVDDDHYDAVFNNPNMSGSQILSRWLTKMRNYAVRGSKSRESADFEYIWRIERGALNSKRLHYHLIVKTNIKNDIKAWFHSKWKFANWAKLEASPDWKDDWFKPLDNRQMLEVYLSKYISKNKISESNMAEGKADLKCRLFSTSRFFERLAPYEHVEFQPDLLAWELKTKPNWVKIKLERINAMNISDESEEFHPELGSVLTFQQSHVYNERERDLGYHEIEHWDREFTDTAELQLEYKTRKGTLVHPMRLACEKLINGEESMLISEKELLMDQAKNLSLCFSTPNPYFQKRIHLQDDFEDSGFHNSARKAQKSMDDWLENDFREDCRTIMDYYCNDEFRFPSERSEEKNFWLCRTNNTIVSDDFDWQEPEFYSN